MGSKKASPEKPEEKTLEQPTFEQQIEELEAIVSSLEGGDKTLEEQLQSFERGVLLARTCMKKLDEVEKRVDLLTRGKDGEWIVQTMVSESAATT